MSTQQVPFDLDQVKLLYGGHKSRENGVCLMEAVSWFANEPHSDHPQCVSPVLTSFGMALNDCFSQEQRQKLKACIPLLVGTRNSGLEQARIYFLANKAVKVFTPIALRAAASAMPADLKQHAETLEAHALKLEQIADFNTAAAARAAAARAAAARAAADAADAAADAAGAAAARAAARAAAAGAAAGAGAAAAARAAAGAADATAAAAADATAAAAGADDAAAEKVYDKAIEVFKEAIAIKAA